MVCLKFVREWGSSLWIGPTSFFFRKFQFMATAPNNNSLLSDQDGPTSCLYEITRS